MQIFFSKSKPLERFQFKLCNLHKPHAFTLFQVYQHNNVKNN